MRRISLALLSAALLVAGCGDDGSSVASEEPSEDVATDESPTTAATADDQATGPDEQVLDACALLDDATVLDFLTKVTGRADLALEDVGPDDEWDIDCLWDTGVVDGGPISLVLYLDEPTSEPACGFSGTDPVQPFPAAGANAHRIGSDLVTTSAESACVVLQRGGPAALSEEAIWDGWVPLLAEVTARLEG